MTMPYGARGRIAVEVLAQRILFDSVMSTCTAGHLSIAIPIHLPMHPQVLNLRTGEIKVLRPEPPR